MTTGRETIVPSAVGGPVTVATTVPGPRASCRPRLFESALVPALGPASPAAVVGDLDQERGALGAGADGGRESVVGEGGGVDPAGEVAQLDRGGVRLGLEVGEDC